jgi:hypothetical protein
LNNHTSIWAASHFAARDTLTLLYELPSDVVLCEFIRRHFINQLISAITI